MRRWILWSFLICGVLVGTTVVPSLLTAMQRSKQNHTMADIRSLATAIEAYEIDHPDWTPPPSSGPATRLAPLLQPAYVKRIPSTDGWSRPLTVSFSTVQQDGRSMAEYRIVSFGRDGKRDPKWDGPGHTFDNDIVFANGSFVQFPEGV